MLRIVQRWLGLTKPPASNEQAAETAVLLVRVPAQPVSAPASPTERTAAEAASTSSGVPHSVTDAVPSAAPVLRQPRSQVSPSLGPQHQPSVNVAAVPSATPRATTGAPPVSKCEALPLAALGAISDRLLRKLRRAGLRSCEDLLRADAVAVVQQIKAPQPYVARIRRYQRAIRFSRRFSAMTPHEALLLFAAHRRNPTRLATENAGILRRDLERLLLSSQGQRLAAGCPVPELARVRQWIVDAKAIQTRKKRTFFAPAPNSELPPTAPARNPAG